MCCFHVTIARKVLGNAHIDYRTNTFQKGALLSWELCWTPSFTKIELSIWDNLYRPSVIPWAIIRCPNPSLCAKQTTHWKTLLYGRQKNKKTSATTNLTTIGGWATPRTPCLLGAVLQQTLLVVRQSDGLRCGTPPGHIRVYRVHQGRAATTLIALVVGYDGANYRAGQ